MMQIRLSPTVRYALLVFFILIGIHSILSFTHEPYGRATSISQLTGGFSWSSNAAPPSVPDQYYNPD
ncbi:hypothetical protein FOMPIDRAFT_93752, partial [Fomitopsis schrenkii]